MEDENSDDVRVFIRQGWFEYSTDPVSESEAGARVCVPKSLLEDYGFSGEMIEELMQKMD